MRKFLKVFSLICLSILLFTSTVSAAPSPQSNDKYELKQLRKIHDTVIKRGFALLNTDGTIVINTNATELRVDEDLFAEYIKNLDSVNFAIKEGGVTFDKNFEVKVASKEEVTSIVYNKDQKKKSGNIIIMPMIDPDQPPSLAAYNIASNNRDNLSSYYHAIADGIWGDPAAAYTASVGYWVAKIQPQGAWDYKTVPGYSPYNKLWLAYTRYGSDYKTTEWFGNYNYGLTGRFLFSLSALLAGGDAVGLLTGGGPDDQADKDAVTQGYNEY